MEQTLAKQTAKGRRHGKEKKTEKAKARADKAGEKLRKARAKLDAQKPPKEPGIPRRLARSARAGAWIYAHNKIHEVEHENVGVEGAHKSELVAETGIRKVSRSAKKAVAYPPRPKRGEVGEKKIRASADYAFHTAAQEHPELYSNPCPAFRRSGNSNGSMPSGHGRRQSRAQRRRRKPLLPRKGWPGGWPFETPPGRRPDCAAVLLVVMLLMGALSSLPGMIGGQGHERCFRYFLRFRG